MTAGIHGMPATRVVKALGLIAALLYANAPWGAVYKWTDGNGQVHYSSQPPPQGARVMDAPSGKGVSQVTDDNTDPALRDDFLKRKREERDARRAGSRRWADELARRAEACKAASERLAQLTGPKRLYKLGENGERLYLSSELLDAERLSAEKQVSEYCR